MRFLHSAAWLLLASAWASAFFTLARLLGGVALLAPKGQVPQAAMNLAAALLCLLIALSVARAGRAPTALLLLLLPVSVVHLVNSLGLYWLANTEGSIGMTMPAVIYPFSILSSVIPTNSLFTGAAHEDWRLIVLPVVTTALTLLAIAMRVHTSKRKRDA
jgi:hypothetical protein